MKVTVTDIGDYAFADCSALKQIQLPTNVNLSRLALEDCNQLGKIILLYAMG